MRQIRIKLIYLCTFLITVSCIKEKYDWDECDASIFVRFDWGTATQPYSDDMVDVAITDREGNCEELEMPPTGEEVTLTPDMYEFIGHTPLTYVEVDSTSVNVMKDPAGNYYEPDYFAGGYVDQEIVRSTQDQIVTIPMRQQTRPLIIRVILQGRYTGTLSHVECLISGIAMSRNINDGFAPIDGQPLHRAYTTASVAYDLTTEDGSVYSDRKTLLGTDGAGSQILDLDIYFNSGKHSSTQLDVTSKMLGFHTENVEEPWVLEIVLNLISEIEVTIEEWHGNYESILQLERDNR